jgi:hypothetical protein
MADMPIFWTILQIAWIVAFIAIGFFTIRFIVRRSRLLGGIVIAGTAIHLIVGALLFSISWLDMPLLRGLHTGDGFWVLAPDARMYFNSAAKASMQGLHAIPYGSASPTFVSTIAVWMDLIGVSPASPLLFNLIAFVLTCGLIVRFGTSGEDAAPPAAVTWPLVTLSFSPTLLFCSTQVLKDLMFACLVAVIALSARELLTRLDRQRLRPSPAALAGGVIGLFAGVYVISGIRAYYAVFIWLSLAATLGLFLFRQRRAHIKRYLGLASLTLATLWLAFMLGAGAYYSYYHNVAMGSINMVTGGVMSSALERLSKLRVPGSAGGATGATNVAAGQAVDSLREGFVLSAGQTNLIRRPAAPRPTVPQDPKGPKKPVEDTGPSRWDKLMDRVYGVTLGLVAMFVPLSLLQALSIVDIQGGRGFLYVTDIDTLFIDASILGITWLLYRERRALQHRQVYLCFCLVVAALSAVLLAYVVTNLGTLFRLRLIAMVPFWMAPLAIARVTDGTAAVAEEAAVSRETPRDPALSPV